MIDALKQHWREYLIEAALLGAFMVSACAFGVILEPPESPVRVAVPDPRVRRALFGMGMSLTAIALIYSRWGKRSGAHLNPSVTLAFLSLRRVKWPDAAFYVAAQFLGAVAGVLVAWGLLGARLSHPPVDFVTTRPGDPGQAVAFLAEFVISFVLMSVVLAVSASRRMRLTGLSAGALIFVYITFEAPLSGMSMNPARSFASALAARDLSALWIYFLAPPLGMLLAAATFKRPRVPGCAKLDHAPNVPCMFCGQGMPTTPERVTVGRASRQPRSEGPEPMK
jgi:aquaporin Z